jgi:alpha-beta hydrolase superfamily lysophospholipase
LADYFASNGFKTFLYDQRGFGYSGGIRGDASIEEMHEDLETVILTIERSLPVFVYCHSLGAAVVFRFILP